MVVIVGGVRYRSEFARRVLAETDDRVRLVGPIYDSAALNALYAHALVYLHGHEVGGTNPSLLRAMGAGTACAALDVPFNRETLDSAGLYFDPGEGSLSTLLRDLESDPPRTTAFSRLALERAASFYRWSAVASSYSSLLTSLATSPRQVTLPTVAYLPSASAPDL